ncbi:hypothetical protein DXT89_13950 [Agrobacterium vitis]|uniref:Uncharacterized protein n=2 Tax=Agrobacterium vitis TaxID=373 RepID=A0A7J4X566_AGRVI|nr:hypothetical protein DXT89_13950 [Agrobacterium vitis]
MEGEGIAKLIGIIAGTFLSLVFVPPKTISGFIRRGASAIVFGFIFGHACLAFLIANAGWEKTLENVSAAWTIASFSSWWGMGLYTKLVKTKADSIE